MIETFNVLIQISGSDKTGKQKSRKENNDKGNGDKNFRCDAEFEILHAWTTGVSSSMRIDAESLMLGARLAEMGDS